VYNKFFRFGCIIICWETTDSESRVICFSYRMWCLIEMTGSGFDYITWRVPCFTLYIY
jgi:hypothetical protein